MRVLIVAGELSADRYAAAIATQLIQRHGATIVAIGGPNLRAVASEFIGDCTAHVSVGLGDRLRGMRPIFLLLDRMGRHLESAPVQRAVIVDFPNFNFEIARRLQRLNVAIDTVITPNFWIWKDIKSAQRMIRYSSQIITIFPPEFNWYRQLSPQVYYFGHPICDAHPVPRRPVRPLERGFKIGLFPGSRQSELRVYLTPIIQSIPLIKSRWPEARFVLPIARSEFDADIATACAAHAEIERCGPLSETDLRALDLAICATGTMSLELVFHRVPTVVLGALPRFTYWIARFVLRLNLPFVALPNIIANRMVVPELEQGNITPLNILNAVEQIASNSGQNEIQDRYDTLLDQLKSNDPNRLISQQIADQIGSKWST